MDLVELESIKCWDVVLIALVLFGSDLFMFLWRRNAEKLSPQEKELLKAYNKQVHVVNRLNSVETFVEQSKAIRKMNAIKKEMQDLAGEKLGWNYKADDEDQDEDGDDVVCWLLFVSKWNAYDELRHRLCRSASANCER